MVLRAAFALALVCLVPFREPDIGLPKPPRDTVNEILAGIRQQFVPDLTRAAREIRIAGVRSVRLQNEATRSEDDLVLKLRTLEAEAEAASRQRDLREQ